MRNHLLVPYCFGHKYLQVEQMLGDAKSRSLFIHWSHYAIKNLQHDNYSKQLDASQGIFDKLAQAARLDKGASQTSLAKAASTGVSVK